VPTWAPRSGFCSITRTDDELSLICAQEAVPADVRAERDVEPHLVIQILLEPTAVHNAAEPRA